MNVSKLEQVLELAFQYDERKKELCEHIRASAFPTFHL